MPRGRENTPRELTAEELRRTCSAEEIHASSNESTGFSDTSFIGFDQKRLAIALKTGLHINSPAHHIFVAGMNGPATLQAVKEYVESFLQNRSQQFPEPRDWCYLYNFGEPHRPIVAPLKRGKGETFRSRIEKLRQQVGEALYRGLTDESTDRRRQEIWGPLRKWFQETMTRFTKEADEEGVLLYQVRGEIHVALKSRQQQNLLPDQNTLPPQLQELQKQPQPMPPEEETALPEAVRDELVQRRQKWLDAMNQFLRERAQKVEEAQEQESQMIQDIVNGIVDRVFDKLLISPESTILARYVEQLRAYTKEHFQIFDPEYRQHQQQTGQISGDPFIPWKVNVFIDNSDHELPPVVVENTPTYDHLVGWTERMVTPGGFAFTDHTKVHAGALAEANDGYLIVGALDLLTSLGSYHALKQVLKSRQLEVKELMSLLGYGSYSQLLPEPMLINTKVIVVGSTYVWRLLAHHDPEFLSLFNVKAEVAPIVPWNSQEVGAYATWVRKFCERSALQPPEDDAIGKVIETAARNAGDQEHLSTDSAELEHLLHEASFVANEAGAGRISAAHVQTALEEKIYRSNLAYDHLQEYIREGKILLSVSGKKVGQINALMVMSLGDISIGLPGRLTARTSLGKPGIFNIQREAKLSGPVMDKADLIVRGYLEGTFAQENPLSLKVTFAFEQSYGPIEGDSASLVELYVILSSIAGVPIRQDIAITSSMNQHGEVQPIGGINHKIEGFFDACRGAGELTGTQGCLISARNIKDLMLREDIVQAQREGKFHIWPVEHVDDGIPLLFEMPAGKLNSLVEKKLAEAAQKIRRFMKQTENPEK